MTGPRDIRALPLDELFLPRRPYNALMRHGVATVGELLALCEDDLRDIRNVGSQSVGQIRAALESVGLCLAPNYRERRTAVDEFAAANLPLPPVSSSRVPAAVGLNRPLPPTTPTPVSAAAGSNRGDPKVTA